MLLDSQPISREWGLQGDRFGQGPAAGLPFGGPARASYRTML